MSGHQHEYHNLELLIGLKRISRVLQKIRNPRGLHIILCTVLTPYVFLGPGFYIDSLQM